MVDALRQVFTVLSDMAEGEFDIRAFQSILQRLNFRLSEEAVAQAFQKLDANEDQQVTFEDFLKAMADDSLFVCFTAGLPDSCIDSKMQKGFLDDRVFFQVLSTLLQSQSLSEGATTTLINYYYRKKKGARLRSKKGGEVGDRMAQSFLGVSVFNLIHYLDILEPDDEYRDQPLTAEQTQAFREAFELLDRNERGNVDQGTLLSTMGRLKLGLDNPFIPDDRKMAAVNRGNEVTFGDFLGIMEDTCTFAKYLDPPEPGRERHRTPETLPFEILLENLETPTIDDDTRQILINYYRTKYRRLEARVLELSRGGQAPGREPMAAMATTLSRAAGDRKAKAPRPKASPRKQQLDDYRRGPAQAPRPAGDATVGRPGDREGLVAAAPRGQPSSTGNKPTPLSTSSSIVQRPGHLSNSKEPRADRQKTAQPPAKDSDSRAYGQQSDELNPGPAPKPKK
eukprot:g29965.t1